MNRFPPIDIKELGYLVFGSANIDRWALFADQVLGAMPVATGDGGLNIRVDDWAARVVIKKSSEETLLGIGWLVDNPAAYARAMAFAREQEILGREGTAAECRDRHVAAFFTVPDPNGTSHEIAWGPQVDYFQPFRSSLGPVEFVTGDQGVGHVVLGARPDRFHPTVEFWVEKLGFALSNLRKNALNPEQKLMEIHWYGCGNGRHHTIATADVATSHPCQHIMLQYTSLDDVGRAYDRVERHGFRYASTMGRHVNDRIISFYVESPSGFWVELGFDAAAQGEGQILAIDDGGKGSVWGHKFLLPLK